MDEEINNTPDFEQNSVDPFDSGESEIDDNEHGGEPGNSSRSMCAECKVVGKRFPNSYLLHKV